MNMGYLPFFSSEIYTLVLLPLFIFIARVLDVSLGTIRVIFISKGFKYLAPVVGFFEIVVWLLAIAQIFQHFTNIVYYVAYAGGFAIGTFVGIYLDNKLLIGTEIIRIITRKRASKLVEVLKSEGYGVTSTDAEGIEGQVKIIYVILDRHDLPNIIEIIKRYNAHAFYTVEDVRFVSERIFPHRRPWSKEQYLNLLKLHRKGK
ncbi:MAG: DUF2179 domain-containing protein [archaeon]|nr:DUF2179 domain-containing protein [archaeon]